MKEVDYVYFVNSGRCKIVREIIAVKTKLPFGKCRLSLVPPEKTAVLSKNQTLQKRYLVLMTINVGGYFGVGEDLSKIFIISDDEVKKDFCFGNKNLISEACYLFSTAWFSVIANLYD